MSCLVLISFLGWGVKLRVPFKIFIFFSFEGVPAAEAEDKTEEMEIGPAVLVPNGTPENVTTIVVNPESNNEEPVALGLCSEPCLSPAGNTETPMEVTTAAEDSAPNH